MVRTKLVHTCDVHDHVMLFQSNIISQKEVNNLAFGYQNKVLLYIVASVFFGVGLSMFISMISQTLRCGLE